MSQAEDHFKKATELKKSGQFDAALSEFRRAVLLDPNYAEAHAEVGRLCRDKANTNPIYHRFAFESYQKAARLAPDNERAHHEYIMAGQKVGRLDDLLREYDTWLKEKPDSAIFKQAKKNILTISMAMMPDQVKIGDSQMGNFARKMALLFGIGAMLFGISLMFGPVIADKMNLKKFTDEQKRGFFKGGVVVSILGFGGVVSRAFIK